jgi:2-octaprenyl-6-methoxyphenol hydroxylase
VTTFAQHEIVIVGGGPVGATLALALAQGGRPALLLESRDEPSRTDDPRTLALSAGSRLILERIGVWHDIASLTPIDTIHVSQRGGFGRALLTAAEAGLPALGYVAPYASLQKALSQALEASPMVSVLASTQATSLEADDQGIEIGLGESGAGVQSKLAVIADGGSSLAGLAEVEVRDYGQSALVSNVIASKPHRNIAFERFTPEGPLALLPHGSAYALVWTMAPTAAEELCGADEREFLGRLQEAFGQRAGAFLKAGPRAVFALRLRVAKRPATGRTVLLGNAAQALHPVAGQGLNLGLRDAWELAECIHADDGDPGRVELRDAYARTRRRDRAGGILLTDALVRVFSNDLFPLRWLRGCGLTFLDCLPPAKRAFMRQMTFGRPL